MIRFIALILVLVPSFAQASDWYIAENSPFTSRVIEGTECRFLRVDSSDSLSSYSPALDTRSIANARFIYDLNRSTTGSGADITLKTCTNNSDTGTCANFQADVNGDFISGDAALTEDANFLAATQSYLRAIIDTAAVSPGNSVLQVCGSTSDLPMTEIDPVHMAMNTEAKLETQIGVNVYTANDGSLGGGHTIEDEGTPLTSRSNLNFTGDGITCTDSDPDTVCSVAGSSVQTLTNKTIDDFSNFIHADAIHIQVRNQSGSTMSRGDLVYISGFNVGLELPLVSLSDADAPATMPSAGVVVDSTLANNATGGMLQVGRLTGIDTSSFSAGDSVYVSTTAGEFSTKPTGKDAQVQKIAKVLRSHGSMGVLKISGASRSNDIPNTMSDSAFEISDNADSTKALDVQLSGATASTKTTIAASQTSNVTLTLPDATGNILAEVGGTFTVDEIEYETATNVAADGSRMAVMRENTVSNPVNCSSIGASDEIQVYNEQGDLKWCDNGVETTFGDGYVEIAEIDVTNASSTQWQVTNWAATYQAVKFEFIDFRPTVSGEGIRMRHLSGCATSCFTITSSQNGYQNLVMNEDHSGGASEENTNDNDYFKFASGAQFRTDTVIEVDSASGAGIKGSWTLYSNGSTNPLFGLHHLGYRDASGGLDVAIVGSTSHELTGVSDTTWDGVEFDGTGSANVTGKIRILGLAL